MKTDDARVAEIRATLLSLVDANRELAEEVGDQLHAFDKRLSALDSEGSFVMEYLDKQLMALDERLMTVEKRLDEQDQDR